MGFLCIGKLGLLSAQPAFYFGDCHTFPGPGANEVCFKFRDHGQAIEEKPADGISGVMDGAANAELDPAQGELVNKVAILSSSPRSPAWTSTPGPAEYGR